MIMAEKKSVKFSIITPTYNRAWCIERAITSVLQQDFQNWEMVIVDDGSTDNTREVIGRYLSDSRIKYFCKENGGAGSARNAGIRNVSGELIMFLDSDDEFANRRAFNIVLDVFKKNNKKEIGAFIFGAVDQFEESTCEILMNGFAVEYEKIISGKAWSGEPFPCVRTSFLKENPQIRFEEDINGGEGIFWLNLSKNSKIFLCKDVVRRYYIGSEDALTSHYLNRDRASNIIAINKKIIKYFERDLKRYNPKQYAILNYAIARMMALLGLRKESAKYFIEGIRYNPFNLFSIAVYFLSLLDRKFKINNYLSHRFIK